MSTGEVGFSTYTLVTLEMGSVRQVNCGSVLGTIWRIDPRYPKLTQWVTITALASLQMYDRVS